jgi:SNF2 family DNA or RNA helicase
VLVFTEFVPTQQMLAEFFAARGIPSVCLNGSMDMEERERVQVRFASESRILISTDAGGEGLNLQFCHVVVNFDIPWNPMRIEQRIGRVDRIGQKRPVKAFNLIFEDSVELRVQEVLEEKLAKKAAAFGGFPSPHAGWRSLDGGAGSPPRGRAWAAPLPAARRARPRRPSPSRCGAHSGPPRGHARPA